ncbi:MAG: hypothetical protein Q9223_001428 [Gallowayella weberi]
MSEKSYPFLEWANAWPQREMAAANDRAKNLLQGPANHQGPPDIERSRIVTELSLGLNAEYVSVHTLVNKEIGDPKSPYIAAVKSPLHNNLIPDRMYVELLGKYLESRILRGQTRFLVDGIPRNRNQAAILEEDICLIRAFIYVEGPKPQRYGITEWNGHVAAVQQIYDILQPKGRAFKINNREDPATTDAFIRHVLSTLRSISYEATLMIADDVFKPPAP